MKAHACDLDTAAGNTSIHTERPSIGEVARSTVKPGRRRSTSATIASSPSCTAKSWQAARAQGPRAGAQCSA